VQHSILFSDVIYANYKLMAITFFDFFAEECFTSGYFEDNVNANNPHVMKEVQLGKLRISHISGDHSS
jgi:hypothetical protein